MEARRTGLNQQQWTGISNQGNWTNSRDKLQKWRWTMMNLHNLHSSNVFWGLNHHRHTGERIDHSEKWKEHEPCSIEQISQECSGLHLWKLLNWSKPGPLNTQITQGHPTSFDMQSLVVGFFSPLPLSISTTCHMENIHRFEPSRCVIPFTCRSWSPGAKGARGSHALIPRSNKQYGF